MTKSVDNKGVKTKKELAMERLAAKYPDMNFDDEEIMYGRINDDYDDYDKQLAGYKDRESKFAEMFTRDPRTARLMLDWRDGKDPVVNLIRMFGTDITSAIDDESKQEEIAAANKEFVERVAKEKELQEEYEKNLGESLAYLATLQEAGTSDADIDAAVDLLIKITRDAIIGIFSPESIDMAMKAIKHDTDVEQAAAEAEVRGKNTKVEEKLRKSSKSDGVPQLNGSNNQAGNQRPRRSMGALDRYGADHGSIWDK